MDPQTASIDLTDAGDGSEESSSALKGHRKLDDIWDHFKKKKLGISESARLHRNYSADCKGCNTTVAGKSTDVDVDFNHADFTNPGAAPVAPSVVRARIGDRGV